jgi:hypothetical protein
MWNENNHAPQHFARMEDNLRAIENTVLIEITN